jgi:hypothetical protein
VDDERKRALKRQAKQREKAAEREAMILSQSELDDLLDHLDERLPRTPCDHSLRLTRAWARENGVDADALATSLERFGGYCDCEVLANVEPAAIY